MGRDRRIWERKRRMAKYAVDAVSGTKKWAFQTGGSTDSSPAVVDGVIYVGSSDQNLYAFALSS